MHLPSKCSSTIAISKWSPGAGCLTCRRPEAALAATSGEGKGTALCLRWSEGRAAVLQKQLLNLVVRDLGAELAAVQPAVAMAGRVDNSDNELG